MSRSDYISDLLTRYTETTELVRKYRLRIMEHQYNIPDEDMRDATQKQQDQTTLLQLQGEYAQAYSRKNALAIELSRLGITPPPNN